MLAALPFFKFANYAEAILWFVMGIGLIAYGAQVARVRRMCLVAGVTLLAFGASDVVEASTGAWYSHWWLLAWKVACVIVLLGVLAAYVRHRRASSGHSM